jgi:hypothetical protein
MEKKLLLLITSFIVFTFFACQERVQGCLDPNATNFEIAGDEPCEKTSTSSKCPCRYPNLVLGTDYKILGKTKKGIDTFYNWSDKYVLKNAANQTYFVKNAALYLSDIQLIRENGDVVYPIDSIIVPIKKSNTDTLSIKVRKDFTLLHNNNFSYTVGSFAQNGIFKKMKFKIGLQNPVNQASTLNKRKIPNDNILNIDSLYLKNSFEHYTGSISYQSDTSKTGKIDNFKFKKDIEVELLFPTNAVYAKGADIRIRLLIDFSQWFQKVDFTKDTPAQIQGKVIANLTKGWLIY